jgi:hypothetical protein
MRAIAHQGTAPPSPPLFSASDGGGLAAAACKTRSHFNCIQKCSPRASQQLLEILMDQMHDFQSWKKANSGKKCQLLVGFLCVGYQRELFRIAECTMLVPCVNVELPSLLEN